jgi:hypothetical protein
MTSPDHLVPDPGVETLSQAFVDAQETMIDKNDAANELLEATAQVNSPEFLNKNDLIMGNWLIDRCEDNIAETIAEHPGCTLIELTRHLIERQKQGRTALDKDVVIPEHEYRRFIGAVLKENSEFLQRQIAFFQGLQGKNA